MRKEEDITIEQMIDDSAETTKQSWLNALSDDEDGEQSDGTDEKTISKSLFTDYVHREHKLRREAEEIPQECEECVRNAFREQVWPDDLNKSPSWQSDDDVTEQTQEWVDAVFQLRDPLFDAYSGIPQAGALQVKEIIQESLTDPNGWSISGVVDQLENEFDFLTRGRAQTIARQEIAATLNMAEKISFEARPEEPAVQWVGPDDQSTTDLCTEIKREVGSGVPVSEIEDIVERVAEKYDYGTPNRADELVPHFQCRHQIDEATTEKSDSDKPLVVEKQTPSGVPDDYHYVSPGMEAPEDADVVTSERGGTYTDVPPSEHVESDENVPDAGEFFGIEDLDEMNRFTETEELEEFSDMAIDGERTVETIEALRELSAVDAESLAELGSNLSRTEYDSIGQIVSAMAYRKGADVDLSEMINMYGEDTYVEDISDDIREAIEDGIDAMDSAIADDAVFTYTVGTLAEVNEQELSGAGEYATGIFDRVNGTIKHKMDVDSGRRDDVLLHEFGHHVMASVVGVEWDLGDEYEDWERSMSRDEVSFGELDVVREHGEEFVSELREGYEAYKQGRVGEMRRYQKRMGNEYAAIGFRQWVQAANGDSNWITKKDPLIKHLFDVEFGNGERVEPEQIGEMEPGDELVLSDISGLSLDEDDALQRGVAAENFELTPENVSDDEVRQAFEDNPIRYKTVLENAERLFPKEMGSGWEIFYVSGKDGSTHRMDYDELMDLDRETVDELIQFDPGDMNKESVVSGADNPEARLMNCRIESVEDDGSVEVTVFTDNSSVTAEITDPETFASESVESGVIFDE